MAYINGKKIFLAGLNINKIQDIPGTVTTWADLFGLSDGVYNVPKRTTNIIYFPTSIFSEQTEVFGLIEVTNSRLIAYGVHKEITREGTESAYTYSAVNLSGKGLSANDYTDEDKDKLDTLLYAVDINSQAIANVNERKVDKVEGKGLSTNDYTDSAKELLETWMPQEFDWITERVGTVEANAYNNYLRKVDKVEGKGLSTNDYTDEDKNNLGKLNGKYGLITTINIEEDVATVDYTFENPLSKMFVQVYVPNETVETSDKAVIYAVVEGLTAGWALMNQLPNAISSTADAYWGYSLDVSEGMLEQYISNVQAINTGRASYTRQISATHSSLTGKLKSIKQIRFSTPSAFPVGTVFTIYGKEA